MSEVYSPNKNKKFYTLSQGLRKIYFKFNFKKRKIIYDLLYITLASKIYQKVSAFFIEFICNTAGFNFFLNNKVVRLLFFSGIRGMSLKSIFRIRNKHFQKIIHKDLGIPTKYKWYVKKIRDDGFCEVNDLFKLEKKDIENVKSYFKNSNLYDGHDPMQSSLKKIKYTNISKHDIKHVIFNKGYFSYDAQTSLNNDIIKSIFYNKDIKNLADHYCGFNTEPYTISTMLNIKKDIFHPVTDFHRDTDDFIALGFFIYWTETNENNGATGYQLGSHLNYGKKNHKIKMINAKPGTIIAGDWMGLHKGNSKMSKDERLITMIRFGKKFNQGYMQTKSYYFF